MEIQIDDNTMLTSDSRNWIIAKKITKKKSENGWEWVGQKFYTSPANAIKGEANREIRQSDAKSFLEAVEVVNKIAKKYDAILTLFEEGKNKS